VHAKRGKFWLNDEFPWNPANRPKGPSDPRPGKPFRSRPGVTSIIIGARRVDQLNANLAALDITLTADQVASLDALTQPTLNFPAELLKNLSLNLAHAGATVNGEPSVRLPSLLPSKADEVY
jgi:hypothetical protein